MQVSRWASQPAHQSSSPPACSAPPVVRQADEYDESPASAMKLRAGCTATALTVSPSGTSSKVCRPAGTCRSSAAPPAATNAVAVSSQDRPLRRSAPKPSAERNARAAGPPAGGSSCSVVSQKALSAQAWSIKHWRQRLHAHSFASSDRQAHSRSRQRSPAFRLFIWA